jgi:hypothetical protein
VERAAYLSCAGRAHRPIALMESETVRVPSQLAMNENAPRLNFEVGDDLFVAHIRMRPAGGKLRQCPMSAR